jgi:plastocyanin
MRRIIVAFGIVTVMVGMTFGAAAAIAQTYGAAPALSPQSTPQPAAAMMPAGEAQGAQNVAVTMEDNYFEPANISVPAGTTVTWIQGGNHPHTTTSDQGLWDSGVIPGGSGGSFSVTFNEPGTFPYHCTIHLNEGMVGTVTVTAGGEPTAEAAAGKATAKG